MPLEAIQRIWQGDATPKDSGTDLVQRITISSQQESE